MDLILKCLQRQDQKIDELKSIMIGQKDVLTFEEMANYSGFSKSHLYKLTSGGKIPHFKPQGKMIFFNKKEIDSWLLRNPVKTSDEIEMDSSTYVSVTNKKPGL